MALIEEAINALKGMQEVVTNEMLVRNRYLSLIIVNKDLAASGAICGGHQACAIGALWLGAGVKPYKTRYGDYFLPGVSDRGDERTMFLDKNPALKLAYDTINMVSRRYMNKNFPGFMFYEYFSSDMEALFEATNPGVETPLIDAYAVFPVLISEAIKELNNGTN